MITPSEIYPKLAGALGVDNPLYFKREDLHPYQSHKGRSIPLMIDHYIKLGDTRFAISSSGNAGLASAMHISQINKSRKEDSKITLDIFVGQNVNKNKLNKISAFTDNNIRVLSKERPLQALTQAVQDGARSLRQSTDDIALIGYRTLAEEISQIPDLGAIFIGTSSGTTAQGLSEYFINSKKCPQIHIVQTSSCHPMFDIFETYDGPEEVSIADAIVDHTANRKTKFQELISKTGGHAWCATNGDIETARKLVANNTPINISTNGALPIVGLMQAVYRGWKINGAIVCIICGE